jgi:hypothetical protein
MAKRAPVDEKPYRPLLDPGVVSAALTKAVTPAQPGAGDSASTKVVELTRQEVRRLDPQPAFREPVGQSAGEGRVVPSPQTLVEKFDQEKRILFTRAESQAIDRLVTSLAGRLNAQVKVSHVMRALVALLLNAEGEVDKRAGETGLLVRPPNGDAKALQRFEREIARIIGAALRDAGPVK